MEDRILDVDITIDSFIKNMFKNLQNYKNGIVAFYNDKIVVKNNLCDHKNHKEFEIRICPTKYIKFHGTSFEINIQPLFQVINLASTRDTIKFYVTKADPDKLHIYYSDDQANFEPSIAGDKIMINHQFFHNACRDFNERSNSMFNERSYSMFLVSVENRAVSFTSWPDKTSLKWHSTIHLNNDFIAFENVFLVKLLHVIAKIGIQFGNLEIYLKNSNKMIFVMDQLGSTLSIIIEITALPIIEKTPASLTFLCAKKLFGEESSLVIRNKLRKIFGSAPINLIQQLNL